MSRCRLLVCGAAMGLAVFSTKFVRAADVTRLPSTSFAASAQSVANSPAVATVPAARSAKELRDAVVESLRRANSAKGNRLGAAVQSLIDLYGELGRDVWLPIKERVRLGVQVRVRLERFASQFRYETAHNNSRSTSVAVVQSVAGSAGPPATQGLNDMVELIQTTIGQPDDWVAAQQRAIQPGGNAQAMAGGIGAGIGGAGAAHGGAFGGNDELQKAAAASGADLVDLIQKTIDPPSWEINGGIGTIMYFNNMHVLVIRQTGEAQDDVGGLLGGLRK